MSGVIGREHSELSSQKDGYICGDGRGFIIKGVVIPTQLDDPEAMWE